jgi:hypothetical protein
MIFYVLNIYSIPSCNYLIKYLNNCQFRLIILKGYTYVKCELFLFSIPWKKNAFVYKHYTIFNIYKFIIKYSLNIYIIKNFNDGFRNILFIPEKMEWNLYLNLIKIKINLWLFWKQKK